MRDEAALRFFTFAGAAFSRKCSGILLAVQGISSERPFGEEIFVNLKPSIRSARVQQSSRETKPPVDAFAGNDRF